MIICVDFPTIALLLYSTNVIVCTTMHNTTYQLLLPLDFLSLEDNAQPLLVMEYLMFGLLPKM